MKTSLVIFTILLCAATPAAAQTEADLKRHFEGRHVTLKIDMPATKDGVNVRPERAQPLDFSDYAAKLKRHGTSIRRGETALVTKVKVKGRHVEFQLGGGGYGTAGDETDATVHVPSAGKSRREKRVEEELKRETDPVRRKRLKEELDGLRRDREREDRLNQAIAAEAEEARRARIEQRALHGGSRFNIHFASVTPSTPTPGAISEALRRYVVFDGDEVEDGGDSSSGGVRGLLPDSHPSVVRVGPPSTFLAEGLTAREVLDFLGEPSEMTERREGDRVVQVYAFRRGGGRVLLAEFVGGRLVRTTTQTGERPAPAAGIASSGV